MRLVSERFPNLGEQAARLFESDEAFHDLCDDYQACVEAATRLEGSGPGSKALRGEYVALQLRLERELLRHLEEHPEKGKP